MNPFAAVALERGGLLTSRRLFLVLGNNFYSFAILKDEALEGLVVMLFRVGPNLSCISLLSAIHDSLQRLPAFQEPSAQLQVILAHNILAF